MKKLALNKDLFKFAKFFFFFVGIEPYKGMFEYKHCAYYFLHACLFINCVLVVISLTMEILLYRFNNILEALKAAHVAVFAMNTAVQIFFMMSKRKSIEQLRQRLESMFPKTLLKQKELDFDLNYRHFRFISIIFIIFFVLIFMLFNFVQTMFDFLLSPPMEAGNKTTQKLLFAGYIPWDYRAHWSYYVLYTSQVMAASTVTFGKLAGDLLLGAFSIQIIMHFNYLGKKIRHFKTMRSEFNGKEAIQSDDLRLKQIIVHHQKLFSLVDYMNEIFRLQLFVNFIFSAFFVCISCCQMVYANHNLDRFKFMMAACAQTLEMGIICFYGQTISDASENIAQDIYSADWRFKDKNIRNMLSIIMMRAQKPAFLLTVYYIPIRLPLLTAVLDLIYKFFCVLRNLYTH